MSEMTERDRIAHMAQTCAGVNLRRASRAITHYYDSLLREACGLRATQVTPLVVLYLAGPQTINEIAERLELDRTTLSRNLRPLEEMGLVRIEPGADQRTRLAALTPKGTSTLLEALPVWEKAQSHVVQGIGEGRFQDLLAHLANVAELAQRQ